ncbi:L-rhamnose mutarotase [Mucilaginibacter terrae]|uniref:L-rhamnose mutarotase n=1 Tax=Mucilaginibacter terrae TaxID=1955052 RepID=UPI0036350ABE
MKKYCFALDLIDDSQLIAEYEHWHRKENSWPEINDSIIRAGINTMEIYRTGNRLFMIMETTDTFSLEDKALSDLANPKIREWEEMMLKYQQPLPWAPDGEKWILMNLMFHL